MIDIVKRLNGFCVDWDGSELPANAEPMDGIHCDVLLDAATEITRLRSELANARNAALEGWQPIDTAPKDGTIILFAREGFDTPTIGFYRDGHIFTGGFVFQPSAIPREWEDVASWWVPLPSPPPPVDNHSEKQGRRE